MQGCQADFKVSPHFPLKVSHYSYFSPAFFSRNLCTLEMFSFDLQKQLVFCF